MKKKMVVFDHFRETSKVGLIALEKKLQNYSPRLGTVIFEAFSLRKRNSMRYTTRAISREKKKIFNNVLMMTKLDNDNNSG